MTFVSVDSPCAVGIEEPHQKVEGRHSSCVHLGGIQMGRHGVDGASDRPLRAVLFTLILLTVPAASVLAQGVAANVSGLVTDDTGGALPGVTVTVTNKANGVSQTLVTGPE